MEKYLVGCIVLITVGYMFFLKPAAARSVSATKNQQLEAKVESMIANNDAVMFSKSYCPYCKKAKAQFVAAHQTFKEYQLDKQPDGMAIQAYLLTKTGQRTVPSIWIYQKFMGGSSDLAKINLSDYFKQHKTPNAEL